MTKKLVVFDLDGVIIDSRDNMERSWAEVRSRLGIDIPFEAYFELIGRPFGDILSVLGLRSRLQEIEPVFRTTSSKNLNLIRFYPDAEKTMSGLVKMGLRLGIVTSKDALRTGAILALLPVKFATVQTPNDLYRGKPAPDHLLAAIAEANADPVETIYIGDMAADAEAARRAGVDYIHAAWGYGKPPASSFATACRFSDIAEILASICADACALRGAASEKSDRSNS